MVGFSCKRKRNRPVSENRKSPKATDVRNRGFLKPGVGAISGCRIMVVRLLWEHVAWVRFPAPRPSRNEGGTEHSSANVRQEDRGRRITALPVLSKHMTGVRLPLPAPDMHIQNSSELWDKIWKKTPGQFPGSSKLESLYRKIIYFSAFDSLLNPLSLQNLDILELGSGTGNNSLYLAKKNSARSVTLVDFSELALQKAREEDFPCEIIKIQQDLLSFFPQEQYGFVHSTGLIEHFTGQERLSVVQKHAECVKPGGYIMIWVPIKSPAFFLIGQFNKLMGIEEIPLTRQELKALCVESGLRIIRENTSVFCALYGVLAQKA